MPFAATLHHVGIIVPDEARIEELLPLFGLERESAVRVEEYEARCVFVGNGGGRVELILPDPGSRLRQFNKGVGGLHHFALEVSDLLQTMRELEEGGVRFLEPQPIRAGDLLVNFVPPAVTRGFIMEYVQRVGED